MSLWHILWYVNHRVKNFIPNMCIREREIDFYVNDSSVSSSRYTLPG